VSEMVSTYTHCLKYHYFPTQSMTNAILTAVGDGYAQSKEASQQQDTNDYDCDYDNKLDSHTDINMNTNHYYDSKRGLVYLFKGLGSGIMWAWWFDVAEVWSMELTQSVLSHGSISVFHQSQGMVDFATSSAATDVLSIPAQTIRTIINILLEQFLVSPILFSLWDIPVTSLMRGSPARQVPAQIREKLLPLLTANAKVWTLVNVVTYNIPLEYRLLFTSAASILSESINSGITSKELAVPEPPKLQPQPSVAELQLISWSANPLVEMGMGASIDATVLVSSAATFATMAPLGSSGGINGKNSNSTFFEL